jgi:thiol-disulfide isomerase/thioredoxin
MSLVPATPAVTSEAPPPAAGRASLSRQAKLGLATVAIVAAVALFWPRSQTRDAPGGFLYDPAGRPATLAERGAPVTLLHFWATWCAPCIAEIPSLDRLASAIESSDFTIVMVAVDDQQDKVAPFLGERAAMALYDPSWEVAHRYGTYKLPETYLLVGNQVVDKFVAAQDWDDPALRRRLAEKVAAHHPSGLTFTASR